MNKLSLITPLACLLFLSACDNYKSVNIVNNPSFEEIRKSKNKKKPIMPADWQTVQHAGVKAYKMKLDTSNATTGKNSFMIHQHKNQVFATISQPIILPDRENKIFSYSAMLKAKDIAPGGGWRLVANCKDETGFIIKQYVSDKINGTTDWGKVTMTAEIPEGTIKIDAGITLLSLGTGWVDDVDFRIDPPNPVEPILKAETKVEESKTQFHRPAWIKE